MTRYSRFYWRYVSHEIEEVFVKTGKRVCYFFQKKGNNILKNRSLVVLFEKRILLREKKKTFADNLTKRLGNLSHVTSETGTRLIAWAERIFLLVTRRQRMASDKQDSQAIRNCQPNETVINGGALCTVKSSTALSIYKSTAGDFEARRSCGC